MLIQLPVHRLWAPNDAKAKYFKSPSMSDEESGGTTSKINRGYPHLNGEKYSIWEGDFHAYMRLKDKKLLKIVKDGFVGATATAAESELDADAKAILLLSVAEHLKAYVRVAASAKKAVESLRQACRGTEATYKQRIEKKEQSYAQGDMKLKTYAEGYMALYIDMEGLGIQPSEDKAMDRLLNGLRPENGDFKRQMQSYRDLRPKDNPFTLQELVSKMMDEAFDDNDKVDSVAMRAVRRDSRPGAKPSDTCMRCGESGHWAKHCEVRDALCDNCGELGHLTKACRAGPKTREAKAMAATTSTKKGGGGAYITGGEAQKMIQKALEDWDFREGSPMFSG